MSLYLIRITGRNWDRDEFDATWLGPNEAPADVHQDLRISQSALSVWHVEEDESNLNLIIVALASTRDVCDTFDFGLFKQEIVPGCNIKVVMSEGSTYLTQANHWHRDLSELTTDKLSLLVNSIFNDIKKSRRTKTEIRRHIANAVREGSLDLTKLKQKMQGQIEEELRKD